MMTNRRVFCGAMLILWVGLLAGCSPSAGDGRQAIENQIEKYSEGRIRLTNFRKTDATEGEFMGGKFYVLEYVAEIEFTEDCKWLNGAFGGAPSFRTSQSASGPRSESLWESINNPGVYAKRGEELELTGEIRFVKKESGWVVDSVKIEKAQPKPKSSQEIAREAAEKAEAEKAQMRVIEARQTKEQEAQLVLRDARIIYYQITVWAVRHDMTNGTPVDIEAVINLSPPQGTKGGAWTKKLSNGSATVDRLGNRYQIGRVGRTQLKISEATKSRFSDMGVDWGDF